MKELYEKYLRTEYMPQIFCPGCGSGTVMNSFIRAIDEMKIARDELCMLSGAGCYGWGPTYMDFDKIHYIHGRSIAAAEAMALLKPDKKIVVFTGDGDNYAIGTNHYLHAARRNSDITVIVIYNFIYGMTGGQRAPSTPYEGKTKTSPFGNDEHPFDTLSLAKAAGVTYFARWTSAHPIQLTKAIKEAMNHKGFSVVEVITQCPTTAGRNIFGVSEPYELLKYIKDNSYIVKSGEEPVPGDPRFALGLFINEDRPTHHDEIERFRKEALKCK